MKRCFIYAAGTFYGLREPPRGGDLQIAADAGLLLCERLGVRPDVVLGDFDSMDVRQAPADCIRVPVEKDDTDTMLALREGLRRGCDTFYLYGATAARGSTTRSPTSSRLPSFCVMGQGVISTTKISSTQPSKTRRLRSHARWNGASFRSSVWATAPSTSRSRGCNIRSRTGRSTAASRSA